MQLLCTFLPLALAWPWWSDMLNSAPTVIVVMLPCMSSTTTLSLARTLSPPHQDSVHSHSPDPPPLGGTWRLL